MQFRYRPPYLNKNLNTWFKGIVNVRYTSKTVCLSFFCKFIKFAHTIQWRFLQKIFVWPFLCIPRVFLFNVTYFGYRTTKNSLTKFEILPLGWTKCPKTEPFFLRQTQPTKLKLKHWFINMIFFFFFTCVEEYSIYKYLMKYQLCSSVFFFLFLKEEKLCVYEQAVLKYRPTVQITSSTALLILQKRLTEYQGWINIHDLSGQETTLFGRKTIRLLTSAWSG